MRSCLSASTRASAAPCACAHARAFASRACEARPAPRPPTTACCGQISDSKGLRIWDASAEAIAAQNTGAAATGALDVDGSDVDEDEVPARDVAVALARVAWETKAEDVSVLDVRQQSSWCSYMVIVTIFSRPQLNAVVAKLEDEAEEKYGRSVVAPSGRSAWEVLDLGDIVVHVLSAEMRDYYDLESFYGISEEVDLPFLEGGAAAGGEGGGAADWRTSA